MAQCPIDEFPLTAAAAEGHAGMRCTKCSGMWLPYAYVDSLRHDRQFDPEAFRERLLKGWEGAGGKRCPAGCGELRVSLLEKVHLDWCASCHGIWFDAGELRRILEAYPRTGSGKGTKVGEWAALDAVVTFLTILG